MLQLTTTILSFEWDWSLFWKGCISLLLLVPIPILLKRLQKQDKVDFDSVLEKLTQNIKERETALSGIRRRQERFTKLLIQNAFLFWLVYAVLWYRGVLPIGYDKRLQELPDHALLVPLAFEPIVCILLLVAIKAWYTHKSNAEEKHLRLLMKERDATLRELKESSKFEATVKLLQLYGEKPPPADAVTQNKLRQVGPIAPQPPTTVSMMTGPPLAPPPFRRQWYDRLADYILGEDAEASESPYQKFALICERCYTHNGLVKEAVFDNTEFYCRKCNYMNPSYASKLAHSNPSTPHDDSQDSADERDDESISGLESVADSETESTPEEASS